VIGGKARVTRTPVRQLPDKERATPPDAAKCSGPAGTSLFAFGCVAPQASGGCGTDMLLVDALPKPKIDTHAALTLMSGL